MGENIGDENRVLSAQFSVPSKRTDGKKIFARCEIFAEHQIGKLVFMRVADHHVDAGKRGDFLWSALGIASSDDDFRQRILPLDAPYGGASVLVGGVCDSTGIKNYQARLRGGGRDEAASLELALDGGAVGLRGAAAEVLYVVGQHRIMVAQVRTFCGRLSGHTSARCWSTSECAPASRR